MQTKFKLFMATAVFVLLCCNLAYTQQTISPEKKALIKEFLEVTGEHKSANDTTDDMMKLMDQQILKMMSSIIEKDQTLTPEEKKDRQKDLDAFVARNMQRYRDFFTKTINLDKLIEDISYPLYDKHFTENELKDLIAFYKTPTGQKLVSVSPALAIEFMTKMFEVILPTIEKFVKETSEAEVAEFLKSRKGTKNKP